MPTHGAQRPVSICAGIWVVVATRDAVMYRMFFFVTNSLTCAGELKCWPLPISVVLALVGESAATCGVQLSRMVARMQGYMSSCKYQCCIL
jgi:hypothetical protein